jgi:replicative superfamily II helicase
MGKLSHRIIAVVLLVAWVTMVCTGNWDPEYRGVVVHKAALFSRADAGQIALFLINAVVHITGKKLDKGYRCPVYCEVKHEHIYETKKSNIQTADNVSRPGTSENREQQENVLRTCTDVHRLCGDDGQIGEAE